MAKTTKNEGMDINIQDVQMKIMKVRIIGDTPLIEHKWSEKAKKEMLDKQMGKKTKVKEVKNPVRDYADSVYYVGDVPEILKNVPDDIDFETAQAAIDSAHYGFPASAFKECALSAGFQQGLLAKKTTARGAFRIIGDEQNGEMVRINGECVMREDMVRIGGISKVADIRYRGEIRNWSAELTITYLSTISPEQIVALLNVGGMCNGVGEWRNEKGGSFGSFHVATGDE